MVVRSYVLSLRHRNLLALATLVCTVLLLVLLPTGCFLWTLSIAAILTSAAAVICLAPIKGDRGDGSVATRLPAYEWAYGALLAFLIWSIVPLPLSITILTGRDRFRQNNTAAQLVKEATSLRMTATRRFWFAATRNRAGSLRVLLLAVCASSTAILASLLSLSWKQSFLRVMVVIGACIGVAGHLALWVWPQGDTLWWVFPIRHVLPGPVTCFWNRNHFAGYLAFLAPGAVALLIYDFGHKRYFAGASSLVAFACLTIGVVSSLSRGAICSYVVGLLAAGLLLLVYRHVVAAVILLLLCCAVISTVLSFPSARLQERLATLQEPTKTSSYVFRLAAWKDSMKVWRSYPIAGAGPNAFRTVYPQHRTTSSPGHMTHSDNEYVQLLTDSGLVGVILVGLLAIALWHHLAAPALHLRVEPVITVATVGAVVVALTNALVDFPLHIPVYTTVLAAVVGLMLAPFAPATPDRPCAVWRRPPPFAWPILLGAAAAALVAIPTARSGRLDAPDRMEHAPSGELVRAAVWAPTSPYAWYYLGRRACMLGTAEGATFGEKCLTAAALYDPNNYRIWKQLGLLRLSLDDRDGTIEAFRRVRELRYWVALPTIPEATE